jgi:hypothetical protein
MELPITEKELKLITESVKYKHPELYNKLWAYQFKLKYQQENSNGLSKRLML